MGLRLHPVSARQGLRWIRLGFALWLKRPLAFVGLFALFLIVVLLLMSLVPLVGGVLGLATLPLLTLGFMIASRSASRGEPLHALQFVEGLRHPDRARRRAQWLLCGGYALCSMAVIFFADWVDGGSFEQLQRALAQSSPGADEVARLLTDPRLVWGMVVRLGLASALSVPYWYAPALVHWGGQGALQALFSSTLAVWRTRGAFTLYFAGWSLVALGVSAAVMLLAAVTGLRQTVGVLTMPLGLAVSAAFYVSLWFGFADSFAPDEASAG
jgi:hypothetical protein